MAKCTLKVNMILGDGHHTRGSVLDRELIPAHLRKSSYIADGVVSMELTTPLEEIELEDVKLKDEDEKGLQPQVASPMRELTMEELTPLEEQLGEQPRKLVPKRKLLPKKR